MLSTNKNGEFTVETCPIIGGYNQQRFKQWSPEDSANWYVVTAENTKEKFAMYPSLGRAHVTTQGVTQLVFDSQPRATFKTINFYYVVIGNSVYRYDKSFNQIFVGTFGTIAGTIQFDFLVVNNLVFACFVDQEFIYIYQEGSSSGLQKVTDANAPGNLMNGSTLTKPGYIAAFGNRITVSVLNSSQFCLSIINLGGNSFNPATCFTNPTTPSVFALENGIIRQMGVLNQTLYIFCDYTTGIWSNYPAVFSGTGESFPWKKNTTYDWNFGIANSESLDIDFGYMVFLASNSDGLLQFMISQGDQPQKLSSKAVDTLLQRYTNLYGKNNPFLSPVNSNGFLYQYENTIFYRMSCGPYFDYQILDENQQASSLEYNFEAEEWHRCVELNGERNRNQLHVYFNNMHLVTVIGESTIYNMSGQYYFNELRNKAVSDPQAMNAYIAYPFRYERVTPIIYQKDYSEFETEFLQIDFAWGDSNISYSTGPFQNTIFLIGEQSDSGGNPVYLIAEQPDNSNQPVFLIAQRGNTPSIGELTYNQLYKPQIELFFSDDGGISFDSADVRQFSDQGVYSWRMRWYQLGCSRNRVYKLIAVSPVPIVILGAVMNVRRISGGAY